MTLPGLVGERLFSLFATRKKEYLDWAEFYEGACRLFSSTFEEKVRLVFDLMRGPGETELPLAEMRVILSHVPLDTVNPTRLL
jgi:hypothetical protein